MKKWCWKLPWESIIWTTEGRRGWDPRDPVDERLSRRFEFLPRRDASIYSGVYTLIWFTLSRVTMWNKCLQREGTGKVRGHGVRRGNSPQVRTRTGQVFIDSESLHPVCVLPLLLTAGFSEHVFPWGGATEQHSTVWSVQHAQWLHCVCGGGRMREQIGWVVGGRRGRRGRTGGRVSLDIHPLPCGVLILWKCILLVAVFQVVAVTQTQVWCEDVDFSSTSFLPPALSLSLSLPPGYSFNTDYVLNSQCCDSLWSSLITSSFPSSFVLLIFYATFRCSVVGI